MDLFASKDERMEKLEKKIRSLGRKTDYNFARVQQSFDAMKKMMADVQAENRELKKDRDFLLGKYKDLLRRLESTSGYTAINEKIVFPIKNEIRESSGLIREIVLEDLASDGAVDSRTGIDSLFELVMNKRNLTVGAAAKELGVDEKRVKYWALRLEKQGAIKIDESLGRTLLVKGEGKRK